VATGRRRGTRGAAALGAWLALALAACAPKKGAVDLDALVDRLDFGVTPRLPAPDGFTYFSAEEAPEDAIVAALTRGRRYDAALGAAAAAIGLDATDGKGALTRWSLREALWRGGWPYPASDARTWETAAGEAPPRDMLHWVRDLPEDAPMGLVRVRGAARDVWVGLRGVVRAELPPVPRRAAAGTVIELPGIPGAVLEVADPGGGLVRGEPGERGRVVLTRAGEWLLRLATPEQEIARFPVYVDVPPPSEPALRLAAASAVGDEEEAVERAQALLSRVRDLYGLRPWMAEGLLDAAAGHFAAYTDVRAADAVAAVGLSGEAVAWACDDVTVEGCIDQWLWDPRRRNTWLDADPASVGLWASLDSRGLHLVLLLLEEG
jgi:hypothetical protein